MRFSLLPVLLCGCMFGQVTTPPGQPPAAVPAPPPGPAGVPDDKVVLTVDGKKYTAGEIRAMASGLPGQFQQGMAVDPITTLQNMFVTNYLASEGEKHGLDQKMPYKAQLEFQRNFTLANAEVNTRNNEYVVKADEQIKYYKEHAQEFQQAKVRVIYIPFSSGQVKSDKKVLTEADAKAKVEDLRKQLAAGADFAKLAEANSEDKDSASKGGEWGVIKRSSKFPDEVKNAVFALKAGEVSAPVRQPNGFYLLKVDELSAQPYEEVNTQIGDKLRQEHFNTWFQAIQSRFKVTVEDPNFFPRRPPAPAPR